MPSNNPALFLPDELTVKRVTLPSGTLPGSVSMVGGSNLDLTGSTLALHDDGILITGVDTVEGVSHSLNKSLGNQYYLYLFGDNPATVNVRGFCLPSGSCDDFIGVSSYDDLFAFYTAFRASGKTKVLGDLPKVTVGFSGRSYHGLLLGLSVNQSDVDRRIAQFTLSLIALSITSEGSSGTRTGEGKTRNLTANGLVLE